jgi:hypothetical protein
VNVRVLIDGIVRQTTILIAQLSTAAGVRAPLAHVADQVFLDLAREIEGQGIGRKVVADMFGLALRSYQKKVQRLTESATDKNRTLWQAVLEFLRDGSKTRGRLAERFHFDDDRDLGAVLNDLVSSGLVYCTGRGDGALYGLTSETDLHAVAADQDIRGVANLVWLQLFFEEVRTEADIASAFGLSPEAAAAAVALLLKDGRIHHGADGALEAKNVVIPLGATEGWEAAVIDHFRAAATAIAAKASRGVRSAASDEIGGTTLTFSVYPGHPNEPAVRALLRTIRAQATALWQETADYNGAHAVPEDSPKVIFYFGQMVLESAKDEAPPSSPTDTATDIEPEG